MAGRKWIGLFFLIFGLGFFLQQADILRFSDLLSEWWPLILIIIGLIQLIKKNDSAKTSGLIFILAGALFLANQWTDANLVIFLWPLFLIFVGLIFIFSRSGRKKRPDPSRFLETFSLFSGTDIRNNSDSFEGGSATAVFGGAEIDLREVKLTKKGASLDLTAVFGGISIKVPDNVHVEITGVPIFGGWEDKTRRRKTASETLPVLKINCIAVFGGVEISD